MPYEMPQPRAFLYKPRPPRLLCSSRQSRPGMATKIFRQFPSSQENARIHDSDDVRNEMKRARLFLRAFLSIVTLSSGLLCSNAIAQNPAAKQAPTPGPMLAQGVDSYDTPDFTLSLVRSSQTVAALKPKGAGGFDFTPGDLLTERSQNGYFHLGDITLRLRTDDSTEWKNYSTSSARTPVKTLPASANVLAAADLTSTLPADLPLRITRTWAVDGGRLVLRFAMTNIAKKTVQIGALGIPMIFNNVLNDRSLDQAHAICSF